MHINIWSQVDLKAETSSPKEANEQGKFSAGRKLTHDVSTNILFVFLIGEKRRHKWWSHMDPNGGVLLAEFICLRNKARTEFVQGKQQKLTARAGMHEVFLPRLAGNHAICISVSNVAALGDEMGFW
jgi:hypothetical protein